MTVVIGEIMLKILIGDTIRPPMEIALTVKTDALKTQIAEELSAVGDTVLGGRMVNVIQNRKEALDN